LSLLPSERGLHGLIAVHFSTDSAGLTRHATDVAQLVVQYTRHSYRFGRELESLGHWKEACAAYDDVEDASYVTCNDVEDVEDSYDIVLENQYSEDEYSEEEYADACYRAGLFHLWGLSGTSIDHARAMFLLDEAESTGSALAASMRWVEYRHMMMEKPGYVVTQETTSQIWKLRDPYSILFVAQMLPRGLSRIEQRSIRQANELLPSALESISQLACQGDTRACHTLALFWVARFSQSHSLYSLTMHHMRGAFRTSKCIAFMDFVRRFDDLPRSAESGESWMSTLRILEWIIDHTNSAESRFMLADVSHMMMAPTPRSADELTSAAKQCHAYALMHLVTVPPDARRHPTYPDGHDSWTCNAKRANEWRQQIHDCTHDAVTNYFLGAYWMQEGNRAKKDEFPDCSCLMCAISACES
jgi:hypothetical protein